MNAKPKILIIDDKIENLISLERLLADLNVELVRATSGNEALKKTLKHDFAIALVDVQMPGMDGFETVEFMRQENRTRNLPVIFVSAIYKEEYHQIRGIETGAVDFITKPIVPKILVGKIRVFLDLHKNKVSMENEIKLRKQSEKDLKKSKTALKRLNEQLKEKLDLLKASEERFKSLVITIPDIVYRIDTEGDFTFINDAIKKLGHEPAKLLGSHFSEIIPPADVETVGRLKVLPKYKGKVTGDNNAPKLFDERRTGKRKTTGLEIRIISKAGRLDPAFIQKIGKEVVVVEINSAGLYGVSANSKMKVFFGTVGVIRDISVHKELEEDLRKARDELEVKVEERTVELSEANKTMAAENAERKRAEEELKKHREHLEERVKERTAELQTIVNAMAGREVRMSELKETIKKLRVQIESEGLTPVADDPLREAGRLQGDFRF